MPSQLETLSHGAVLALSLLATAACYGVVLYQMTVVRLTGAVTLSQPFISQLVLLKRTYFSLGVIVTSPALLLFALCPGAPETSGSASLSSNWPLRPVYTSGRH